MTSTSHQRPIAKSEFLDSMKLHSLFLTGSTGGVQAFFQDYDFSELNFSNYQIKNVIFKSCRLPKKSDMNGCTFEHCELNQSWLLDGCKITNSVLIHCVIAASSINSSDIKTSVLSECKIDSSQVLDSLLGKCSTSDTNLKNCDLSDFCAFKECIFYKCDKANNCEIGNRVIRISRGEIT